MTLTWEDLRPLDDEGWLPQEFMARGHWTDEEFVAAVRQYVAEEMSDDWQVELGPIKRGWGRWVPMWSEFDDRWGVTLVPSHAQGQRGVFPYTAAQVWWEEKEGY